MMAKAMADTASKPSKLAMVDDTGSPPRDTAVVVNVLAGDTPHSSALDPASLTVHSTVSDDNAAVASGQVSCFPTAAAELAWHGCDQALVYHYARAIAPAELTCWFDHQAVPQPWSFVPVGRLVPG